MPPTALTPGSRLGPYEILSALGAGGMGDVYRARFEREAKTLASLNQPNIGATHGLEDANGVTALVLELVEGPTLADRIAKGAAAFRSP